MKKLKPPNHRPRESGCEYCKYFEYNGTFLDSKCKKYKITTDYYYVCDSFIYNYDG